MAKSRFIVKGLRSNAFAALFYHESWEEGEQKTWKIGQVVCWEYLTCDTSRVAPAGSNWGGVGRDIEVVWGDVPWGRSPPGVCCLVSLSLGLKCRAPAQSSIRHAIATRLLINTVSILEPS